MGFDDRGFRANKSPRTGETAEGSTTTGGKEFVAATPKLSDRAEALEQVDNGRRLAAAMALEVRAAVQLPTYVPPPLDEDSAKRTSSRLLDAQGAIYAATHEVPLEGERAFHFHMVEAMKSLQRAGAILAERFGDS